MDSEPRSHSSAELPAELTARQDRLEQQVADLSRKLEALQRQLSPAALPEIFPSPGHPSAITPTPPPPPLPPADLLPNFSPPPPAARLSLENRLGSQVFNRIGIVTLLIGATWFLKLAVDNQWIGPTGRVLIGLLAGVALVLWSERFRRKGFPAFSYSLKALGSGVLYLALWASFQLYHLLPASAALVAMLLVTAWNAYMAWAQDAELLAAYALSGGLATPLLLSTGGNHELFLFTYLLAIDLAVVVLARLRSWPRLLPGALAATAAYFIGWYTHFFSPPELALTAVFAVLFAAAFASPPFFLAPGAHTRGTSPRPQLRVLLEDVLLPLAAATFAGLALYSVLQDSGHHDLLPWLMLALSAIYLGLQRLPQPALPAAIHLSIAVVFLTIAIPLRASGPWIVIAWLVEGTALLWVSTRTQPAPEPQPVPAPQPAPLAARALSLLASAALLLGFGGILVELLPYPSHHTAFLNRGFATALTGLVTFALSLALLLRLPSRVAPLSAGNLLSRRPSGNQVLAAALTIAFSLTVIAAGIAQINLLFVDTLPNTDVALQRALAVSAFLMLYGAIVLAIGFWQRSSFVRWQALILLVFTIAKTFLYDMRSLSQGYRVLSFVGLGALLMAVSFAYQKDWLALRDPTPAPQPPQDSTA